MAVGLSKNDLQSVTTVRSHVYLLDGYGVVIRRSAAIRCSQCLARPVTVRKPNPSMFGFVICTSRVSFGLITLLTSDVFVS